MPTRTIASTKPRRRVRQLGALTLAGLAAGVLASCSAPSAPTGVSTVSTSTSPPSATAPAAVSAHPVPAASTPPRTAVKHTTDTAAKPKPLPVTHANTTSPQSTRVSAPMVTPPKPPTSTPSAVHYKNCAAATSAGVAPIKKGQPGYSKNLDRDGDGIACDK